MKLVKLNSEGIAHFVIPLIVIVLVGVAGSYVAVKSRSHADSLTDKVPASTVKPSTQEDNQVGSANKVTASTAAFAASEGMDPSDAASMSHATTQTANSSPAANCQRQGRYTWSTHYQKCVDLVYSYSGYYLHTSAQHYFNSRFTAHIYGSCNGNSGFLTQFIHEGGNAYTWWNAQYWNYATTKHSFSLYKYSDAAQNIVMIDNVDNQPGCSYTIHIFQ